MEKNIKPYDLYIHNNRMKEKRERQKKKNIKLNGFEGILRERFFFRFEALKHKREHNVIILEKQRSIVKYFLRCVSYCDCLQFN